MDFVYALLLLAVGAGAGFAVAYLVISSGSTKKELEEKLATLQAEYDAYQQNVTAHFNKTAELVNNLTDSYRQVHNHLSSGAQELCKQPQALEGSARFIALADPEKVEDTGTPEPDLEGINPPRDYADPAAGEVHGTLAEDFGLKSKQPSINSETGLPAVDEEIIDTEDDTVACTPRDYADENATDENQAEAVTSSETDSSENSPETKSLS